MYEPMIYTTQNAERREALARHASASSRRLLLLTSRPTEAYRVVRMLSEGGAGPFDCEAVTRAAGALRSLRRGSFDAVLVNAGALHGNPLAELERLCEFAAAVPVLLVVQDSRAFSPAEAIRRGVQEVLRRDELTPERLAGAIVCGVERQRRFAALRDLSLTDPLTGLHNRRGFHTLAEAHLKLMRRNPQQTLLLCADLDHLKQINDSLGHAAGDRALQLCAEALARSMRDSDIISRYGGDEFAALALHVCDNAALVLLPRVAATLSDLTRRARLPFALTMSVGTAGFGRGGTSLDEALACADRMVYSEKRRRSVPPLVRHPRT